MSRRALAVLTTAAMVLTTAALPMSTAHTVSEAPAPLPGAGRHLETVLDRPVEQLTTFRGDLYFAAGEPGQGVELWRSDGSRRGTFLLKDARRGSASSYPTGLTATRDALFFFATGPKGRTDLWKSDGTRAGTVRVKRGLGIDTYDVESAAVGDLLFFFARDLTHGPSLWRSDGTAAGTILLEDHLSPGWRTARFRNDDSDDEMVAFRNKLFVVASDGVHGNELWKSNGTRRGTKLVRDIRPGPHDQHELDGPKELTAVGGRLFFNAGDGTHGRELWKSDGTRSRTVMVRDITPGNYDNGGARGLTALGKTLYFSASDQSSGWELWKSDGTRSGTVLAVDLAPGTDDATNSSLPYNLTAVGDTLFFSASRGDDRFRLWKSDGTVAGTVELFDFDPDGCPDPNYCRSAGRLTRIGQSLYFRVEPEYGETTGDELWVTDGTGPGTGKVDTFSPVPRWDEAFDEMTDVGGTLFLIARDGVFTAHLLKVVGGPAPRPTCHGFPATITGSGTIIGTPRTDVIVGSNGADTIDGGGGNDVICAGDGHDVFVQGASVDGADSMNGQGGTDTVSYADRTSSVRVDLSDGDHVFEGASHEFDATIDVENARGGHAADTLSGSREDNLLDGGDGNDIFTGYEGDDTELGGAGDDAFDHSYEMNGADTIEGQSGTDTLSFEVRNRSQHITIDVGVGDDGAAGEGDTVRTVENVIGGSGNDVITGNASNNVLDGGEGNDRLTGNGGADTVDGGHGDDVLDLRDGVAGNDAGDGGGGADTATFDPGDVVTNVP